MANPGQNQGFRVLDEFVCEAIHPPTVPQADQTKQGQNEGMRVIQELVVDDSAASPEVETASDDNARSRSVARSGKELFSPMDSSARIGGLIGSVIAGPPGAAIGAMLGGVIHGFLGPTGGVGANICKRCGKNQAEMQLDCCRSPVCRGCFEQMTERRGLGQMQFRCSICGQTRSTKSLVEPDAAADRPRE